MLGISIEMLNENGSLETLRTSADLGVKTAAKTWWKNEQLGSANMEV